jgi:3-hydroxyisobutyrate dehydrogenase-like beta-hydroxyacid dehydrogenase
MTGALRVGLVGLGVMGIAYARNLRKAGFAVAGYDPAQAAMDALADCGGVPLDGPAAVATASDVILMALPSVAALDAALSQMRPVLRPGQILAEMSTLPLDAKEAARDLAAEAGAVLLDCPVSGTGAQAAKGDLVVFASGDAAAVETVRPVFTGLARDVRHVGAFGAGMKLKYVANLLVSIHNLASAEALLLAEKSGLDLQMVYEAIGSGAGTSRMFEVRAPLMIEGRYEPATMSMGLYQKDLALIMDHARAVDCPVPLMAATLPFYSAAMAQGRAREDTAALFAVLQQMSTKAPA